MALLRGWFPFYRLSVGLGVRSFARGRFTREALIRVLAPLEDVRLFELPETVAALGAASGERVLDMASPKLCAVALARSGVRVTSVDLLESEIETWRELTRHVDGLDLEVADGRQLPFADASFDHAYSISAIEHIADDGDFQALAELARVVKPGGRIVFTVPYGATYAQDWREQPLYGEETASDNGRWFFSHVYDDARLARIVESTPGVSESRRRIVRFNRNWLSRLYYRGQPATLVLNPVLGLTLHVVEEPGGFAMVELVRR
jgi:SAM-dependent methyltransferase